MWYQVSEDEYYSWQELGVFKSLDEAIDCILSEYNGLYDGSLTEYDLVNGLPRAIKSYRLNRVDIENINQEDIKDSDTAYTLDNDEVIFIHHEGKLNI